MRKNLTDRGVVDLEKVVVCLFNIIISTIVLLLFDQNGI